MSQISRHSSQKGGERSLPTSLLLVTGVLLCAFAVRALTLEAQSLWRDEVDALCYAFGFHRALGRALGLDGVAGSRPPCACPPTPVAVPGDSGAPLGARLIGTLEGMIRNNGPLYYLLLRGWIAVAGSSVAALRYFSLWFGVLGVALAYALGRRLLGRAAGVLTAVLMGFSPYMSWYSQEVKMYTLVPALALLAIYGLRRAVEEGEAHWWLVQIGATSLAFYTHIWSALLIPVQVALFLLWWPRSWRRWLQGLLSLALLTLPYLPLAAWQVDGVFVRRETGFPSHTLGGMVEILMRVWSAGRMGWRWEWAAAACGGAVVLGVLDLVRRRRGWRITAGLIGWIALPLLGIWFVSLRQPLFTDRYLIWSAPAFYLLAAGGLAFLWRHGRWPMIPLLAAILILFGVNLWYQGTLAIKSDIRAASGFVEERYASEDLLIFQIPHVRYTFDYYFAPLGYDWADGIYTNYRSSDGDYEMSPERAALWMSGMTHNHQRVWLIASEVGMWDERHLVEEWLASTGTVVTEAHFAWVDVVLYRMP